MAKKLYEAILSKYAGQNLLDIHNLMKKVQKKKHKLRKKL